VMVQIGLVAAWAAYMGNVWGLATALLVANAVNGFGYFGQVAGSVVTEAPGVRAWQSETSRFAGGVDLMNLPPGIDLVSGAAPEPEPAPRTRLQRLDLVDLTAVHDDGTIGVSGVNLSVEAGELVLLVGQVGSGKSSLLSSLAGLIDHRGELRWNGEVIDDPQLFLRPGQVSHVAQVPRVLSGTFADNVRLGHPRAFDEPVAGARLDADVADAGGKDALVGHRGVRLSGGQIQRLALARALATDAELLLADDVWTRPPRSSCGRPCASVGSPSSVRRPNEQPWPRPTGSSCLSTDRLPRSARGRSCPATGPNWPVEIARAAGPGCPRQAAPAHLRNPPRSQLFPNLCGVSWAGHLIGCLDRVSP
jgi:ABC-type iron transport system FetAB ATPase subunit